MASINLVVNSNTAQAQKDLKKFAMRSEDVKREINEFRKSFKTGEIDKFIDKNRRAAAAVTATDGPLKGAQAEQKALRKEIQNLIKKGLDPQSDALRELTSRYDTLTADIDQAKAQQKKMTDEQKKAAAQTRATQKAQAEANERFKAGIKHLVAMAAAYISVRQAAQFIKGAATDAMDYTKAIANVNTMIEMTTEDYEMLNTELRRVSEEYAVQKVELTGGVYQALSAGAKDLAEALEIVEASTILSKGALIENAQAVDIVTTAMNAYGSETVSATDAIDTFFTIVRQGKITGDELSQTIGQSISLFASAKIPIEELGAGIATLTKVGVQSSEATTQLNGIVRAFIKPTTDMTAALREAGIESGSMLLQTQGLAGALSFLEQQTGGNLDKLTKFVPNIRGLRGALAAGAEEGKVFADVLEAFAEQTGAANTALEAQTEGFAENAFKIEQAQIKLANFRQEIGAKILPVMVDFIENIESIGLALAGATSALITFLAVSKGTAIIHGLTAAFAALNAVIAANPFLAVATVISAILVPAIIKMVGATKDAREEADNLRSSMDNLSEREAKHLETRLITVTNQTGDVFEAMKMLSEQTGYAVEDFYDLALNSEILDGEFKSVIARTLAYINKSDDARVATEEFVKAQTTKVDGLRAEREMLRSMGLGPPNLYADTGGGEGETPADLQQRLDELYGVEQIAHEKRLSSFGDFLAARMRLEDVSGADREAFILNELKRIESYEDLSIAERHAATVAANELLDEIRQENKEAELEAIREISAARKAEIDERLSQEQRAAQMAREIDERQEEERKAALQKRLDYISGLSDARKTAIEERLTQEQEAADMMRDINARQQEEEQELLEKQREATQERIDNYARVAEAASSVWGSINQIQANQAQEEMNRLEKTHRNEIELLKSSGATDKEIADAKEANAEELDQKRREMAKAQAERDKQMNLFSAITSTAAAIAKALPNLLLAGLAGAMGAAQIAAIASTPIPKAQTGTPAEGYTIPDTGRSSRADRVGIMASPGENVSITPRGERRQTRIILNVGNRAILDVVKDGIDNGDIIISTDNIQGANIA